MASLHPHDLGEDRHLKISENGIIIELDYGGLESFHQGDAWWGCTVGFRALQLAAKALSTPELWDRKSISVTSKHPGPCVRDAFEHVTHPVSSNRYQLDLVNRSSSCNRDMEYEWIITSADTSIRITLRADFVPQSFFELLDRLDTARERKTDRDDFYQLKTDLCRCLWREPLNKAFILAHL